MEYIKAFFLIVAVLGGMALIVNAGKIGKHLWEWINEPPITKTFDGWFEGDDSLRRYTVAKLLESDPRWWRIRNSAASESGLEVLYAIINGVNPVVSCISKEGNKISDFHLNPARGHYDIFSLVAQECIVKEIPDFCRLVIVPENPEWKKIIKEIHDDRKYLYKALNEASNAISDAITEAVGSAELKRLKGVYGLDRYDYTCYNPASIVGDLVPADNQPN